MSRIPEIARIEEATRKLGRHRGLFDIDPDDVVESCLSGRGEEVALYHAGFYSILLDLPPTDELRECLEIVANAQSPQESAAMLADSNLLAMASQIVLATRTVELARKACDESYYPGVDEGIRNHVTLMRAEEGGFRLTEDGEAFLHAISAAEHAMLTSLQRAHGAYPVHAYAQPNAHDWHDLYGVMADGYRMYFGEVKTRSLADRVCWAVEHPVTIMRERAIDRGPAEERVVLEDGKSGAIRVLRELPIEGRDDALDYECCAVIEDVLQNHIIPDGISELVSPCVEYATQVRQAMTREVPPVAGYSPGP